MDRRFQPYFLQWIHQKKKGAEEMSDVLMDAKRMHAYLMKVLEITGFNPEAGNFTSEMVQQLTDEVRRMDLLSDAQRIYNEEVKPVLSHQLDADFIEKGKKALRICRELTPIAAWYEQAEALLAPEDESQDSFLEEIRNDGYVIMLKFHYLETYLKAVQDEKYLPIVKEQHLNWLKHTVKADETVVRAGILRERMKTRYEKENRSKILLDIVKWAGSNVLRFKRAFGTPEKPFFMVHPYPAKLPDSPETTPDLPQKYCDLVEANLDDLEMDQDGVLNWKPGIKDENGNERRDQWQPDIHSGILLKGMPDGDPPGSWKVFKVQDLSDPLPDDMKKYYRLLMLKYFGPELGNNRD